MNMRARINRMKTVAPEARDEWLKLILSPGDLEGMSISELLDLLQKQAFDAGSSWVGHCGDSAPGQVLEENVGAIKHRILLMAAAKWVNE